MRVRKPDSENYETKPCWCCGKKASGQKKPPFIEVVDGKERLMHEVCYRRLMSARRDIEMLEKESA